MSIKSYVYFNKPNDKLISSLIFFLNIMHIPYCSKITNFKIWCSKILTSYLFYKLYSPYILHPIKIEKASDDFYSIYCHLLNLVELS